MKMALKALIYDDEEFVTIKLNNWLVTGIRKKTKFRKNDNLKYIKNKVFKTKDQI